MAILTNGTQTLESGARTSVWRSVVNAAIAVLDNLRGLIGDGPVYGETPTGAVDGVNDDFTTANSYVSGSLRVYGNGYRFPASQIAEVDDETFTITPAPGAGAVLIVDYDKKAS